MIGYLVFKDKGLTWRDNQGGLMLLSPPGVANDYTPDTASELCKSGRALFVRWDTHFDLIKGGLWWHIIKDEPETLESLPKKTRYYVRQAAKSFYTKLVDRSEIIEKGGYEVYRRAYARYQTHEPMYNRSRFNEAIAALPETTEFWACYKKSSDEMVAFSENYIENKVCFYVSMWFVPEAMQGSVGYLMFHDMNHYYLTERKFSYVSDGARALSHATNIHEFLQSKFGFRKAYSSLNVVYTPWLAFLVKFSFPFRGLIGKVPLRAFRKAAILLHQEEIRRECQVQTV